MWTEPDAATRLDSHVPFFPFRLRRLGENDGFEVSNHLTAAPLQLNRHAAEVLRLANGETTLGDIISKVAARYPEAPGGEVRAGVLTVLDMLAGCELIWWRRSPSRRMPAPVPSSVFCEITAACNLRCLHCVIAAGPRDPSELSTERWLDLIAEMAAFGVQALSFSGGEPLMHPGFFQLAEHARGLGMSVQLATNGTLVTERMAAWLKEIEADVQVSLDGSTAAIHDQMRPGRDAFESTISGIRELVRAGHRITIGTVVSRLNLSNIPSILELARTLGAVCFRLIPFVPKGRGRAWADLEIEPIEMAQLSRYLIDFRTRAQIEIAELEFENVLTGTACSTAPNPSQRIGCDGAIAYGTITPTGELLPCHFFEGVRADSVRVRPFGEVWQHSRFLNYFRNLSVSDLHGACASCGWLPECRGSCRAVNFAQGDLLGGNRHCHLVDVKGLNNVSETHVS